ncbi:MAG: phosphoglucosamine mutase [Bacteroidota bacterium]|nr:phosphoglucosamine mutase [Bacteroidota bacterium]
MTLIKSISGIRGTIGGKAGEGLSPIDIVKFTSAFASWTRQNAKKEKIKVVVGRDARISGEMVEKMVIGTLIGMGADVVHIGLATTPTTEIAVTGEKADGGLILTASHNPVQWNALKLLGSKGEFLSDKEGKEVLSLAEKQDFDFATVDKLGKVEQKDYTQIHIQKVLDLPLVHKKAIKKAKFKVVIDCVNSVGGIVIPELLKQLGVKKIICLNCDPSGHFAHNPEPIPENLKGIAKVASENKIDVGFVVDPDVDRLAIIKEDGSMFGEEYTLVSVADYVLKNQKGNTVSNLSSTRALRDITENHGGQYFSAAVGEVNVVTAMKEHNAVIGGEGNGGVIYPEIHYGRDALVGIALFLTHLAKSQMTCSQLRATYPEYSISKNKIQLTPGIDVDKVLAAMKEKYKDYPVNDIDGVKIEFEKQWVHLRKSNTEPIIRIYSESDTLEKADALAHKIMDEIQELIK